MYYNLSWNVYSLAGSRYAVRRHTHLHVSSGDHPLHMPADVPPPWYTPLLPHIEDRLHLDLYHLLAFILQCRSYRDAEDNQYAVRTSSLVNDERVHTSPRVRQRLSFSYFFRTQLSRFHLNFRFLIVKTKMKMKMWAPFSFSGFSFSFSRVSVS